MSLSLGPSGLSGIETFTVPHGRAEEVRTHLRKAGQHGVEGAALWAGIPEGERFEVKETIIPEQTTYRTEDGLLYVVDGDELRRINRYLYESSLVLGCQLHSHPGRAYHSETDDDFAVVTVAGGLSLVLPDFGNVALDPERWAVYRLLPETGWTAVPREHVASLVRLV